MSGETCITDLSDVDFCGRDDFDPWRSHETFGHDTDECLYVLTGLMWSKRFVIFPLLDGKRSMKESAWRALVRSDFDVTGSLMVDDQFLCNRATPNLPAASRYSR